MVSLDARSERNLIGVHPDLVKVIREAFDRAPDPDPVITEGRRTVARQRELVAKGASRTMNSRHIPGRDGLAKAVDVAFIIGGKVRWDWPLYAKFAATVKDVAREMKIPVEWGGDWKSFKDGPHFQLNAQRYP
jgi:peptidoglycan L-alanyl-D-glutamate endopeptidase CwlK